MCRSIYQKVYVPMGNHDPVWAPQNVYHCLGDDDWVAIAATGTLVSGNTPMN